jgi:hypothetical protein
MTVFAYLAHYESPPYYNPHTLTEDQVLHGMDLITMQAYYVNRVPERHAELDREIRRSIKKDVQKVDLWMSWKMR